MLIALLRQAPEDPHRTCLAIQVNEPGSRVVSWV